MMKCRLFLRKDKYRLAEKYMPGDVCFFFVFFRKKEIFIALKVKQGKISKNMCEKLPMAEYGKLCRQNRISRIGMIFRA